jgi:putative serine protease PepD
MATETSPTTETPTTGGRPRWWWFVGLAVALVIGGVVGGLVGAATSSSASSNTCSATKVANQTLPTIVTITARKGAMGGTGSGEIIRSDGYILTNNHVVSIAADGGTVDVLFSSGKTAPATITGRDPKADLAVVHAEGQSNLPVIPFGQSKEVEVGQPVAALGAPLGLSNTVTSGIVSALDRTIEVPSDNGQTALLVSAVQTDAAINPGNSGGALVDCGGKLIGVPSAGATAPAERGASSSGSIGLGFAIPVDLAKAVSDEIIATGNVTHAYFGIQVIPVPEAAAKKAGVSQGLYVVAVVPGGPSADAGLQAGDIITEINGEPAVSADQLSAITITKREGDTVTLTYVRNGKSTTTKVTLGAQP